MNLREAAQHALEAMDSKHDMTKAEWRVLHYRAFTALRDALAEATIKDNLTVEPVAWMTKYEELAPRFHRTEEHATGWGSEPIPLYTAPPQREPVAYRLSETDIYDFAGWLTTRPGVLEIGTSKEAGPMAEAVGEYIKTFPERFTALPQRKPLTDAEIKTIYDALPKRYTLAMFARAIERAHGIGGKE